MGGVNKNLWPEEFNRWEMFRDAFLAPADGRDRMEIVVQQKGEDSVTFQQRLEHIQGQKAPGFHKVYICVTRAEPAP